MGEERYLVVVLKNWHWILAVTIGLSCQSLLIQASKVDGVYPYSTASTIFLAEVVKFALAAGTLYYVSSLISHHSVYQSSGIHFRVNADTIPYAIPALIYFIQNNLVFFALSYMDSTTYQVLVNLKILSTGVLFRAFLGKELSNLQWAALVLLTVGCATSQIPTKCDSQSLFAVPLTGILICIILSILSASAGIATEWIMKKSSLKNEPLHRQNLHLYFFGIVFCGIGWIMDHQPGESLFTGYNFNTVLIVLAYSFSGLFISIIMKYADNMVKIYAVAVSMVLTTVVSMFLFNFSPSTQFFFGVVIITISILMYFNILTPEPLLLPSSIVKEEELKPIVKLESEEIKLNVDEGAEKSQ